MGRNGLGGGTMKRTSWILAVVASVALVASACTSGENTAAGGATGTGEQVTLDFWIFNEIADGDFYPTLVSDFEAAHPNVNVELTTYPEENYDVKLQTAIAAGKAPDLMLSFGPEYPRQGLLLPIDDALAAADVDLSTFNQAIMGEGGEFSCKWEGKTYCVGSYQGLTAMFYNKDLFDAAGIPYPAAWPPMTPDEFIDIACKLTDPPKGVWGGGASDPLSYLPWEVFFSSYGRTATVNSPDMVHQFEVLASGYDQGCIPSSNLLDPWEQGRDFFAQGKLAMVVTDWLDLKKIDKAGINYGTTSAPTPSGYEPYFFSWSDSAGVMSSSDHPDEAMQFLGFMATAGQKIQYETTGDIPLDSAVADEVDWAHGVPGREDGLEIAKHARAAVFVPNRWDVVGPYYDAWGYVVDGEKSAQEALDEAQPAIQENLDKAWRDWEEGT
jgi:ABC-type glycerol-3-phosphate transport system substrate-binding protein